ncbi:MAG: hypothetical protein AB8H86_13990 [Polyangiales bacterium]
MNNVALIVAMLALGACATSTTPSGGVDGGSPLDASFVDVPAFDISAPSDAGRDIMAPLFDAGPPRVDTGPRDAGPPPRPDAGPPRDAGRPDTGPLDGGFCSPDGLYDTIPAPTNPGVCDAARINTCRVGSAGDRVRVSCGAINTACTLDSGSCTCSGTTEFAGVVINMNADFERGSITFMAMGEVCNFTLTSR